MFFDVKNILGVGQARNRVRKAVDAPPHSDCSATACSSSGTPCTATPPPTPRAAGPSRPGTGQKLNPRPWTCSPASAARSSPPDFCPHRPDQPQPKKSSKSSKPGPWPPHNRESRVLTLPHKVASVSGVFPTGVQLRLPEIGFQAIQLSPYHTGLPALRPIRLGTSAGFLACYCPFRPFGLR